MCKGCAGLGYLFWGKKLPCPLCRKEEFNREREEDRLRSNDRTGYKDVEKERFIGNKQHKILGFRYSWGSL